MLSLRFAEAFLMARSDGLTHPGSFALRLRNLTSFCPLPHRADGPVVDVDRPGSCLKEIPR
jgi:hypothetical protein